VENRSHFKNTTLHSAFTASSPCDQCGLDPATIVDGEAIGLVEAPPTATKGVPAAPTIGGLYGIGGGSILAPILIAPGCPVYEVATATLTATFLTSIADIAPYQGLRLVRPGAAAA
jgi:hypothetical protein